MTSSRDGWGVRSGRLAFRVALGVALGAAAAVGQLLLRRYDSMPPLIILPYPAILLAVALGGLAAGMAALTTTALALLYVVEPTGSLAIAAHRDALDLTLFVVIGLVLVLLSDRRQRALALARAAHARAEDAAASREAMMAVIAHDLRNPLQTVALTADLLAAKLETDARAISMIDRMRRSVQRAVELIDATVDRAGESGGSPFRVKKSPHSLVELMGDVLAQYEPLATAHGITLRLETCEGIAVDREVWCDKERLMQVLGNLLSNALKFTPAGGTVEIGSRSYADGAHITVSDTGRGMTADELAHCFGRFWHGRSPGYGSGLGLWIARTLVEAHGGHLSATSRLGHGTTMTIYLPAERVPAPAEVPSHRLVPKPSF